MPEPAATSMFDHVYAEPHAPLERQRAQLHEYEASFADGTAP
jgi:pyruvate dehydrogenase E1 component alpha subunit